MSKQIKKYHKSVYSTEALLNSDKVYKELRGLGDIIYLTKHKLYAATTYDAVTKVLGNNKLFISGKGISANKLVNSIPQKVALVSDGQEHLKRKGIIMRPLTPNKMKKLRASVDDSADQLVRDLLQKGEFDVVKDFASHLPLNVVRQMVGLPKEIQPKMLKWANNAFQTFGSLNWRTIKALPSLMFGLKKYVLSLTEDTVEPGGWAAGIFAAIKSGQLELEEGQNMIMDYVVPSLDSTILATARLFQELADHPDQYKELRAKPELISSTVYEAVRLACPGRAFTRYLIEDHNINGYDLPKDTRILAIIASGNMDAAKYPNPESFDIHRNPTDQLGWGHGVHACAGMHLAKLEMEALVRALCKHVEKLEVGSPTYIVNNILQGYETIPGKLVASTKEAVQVTA